MVSHDDKPLRPGEAAKLLGVDRATLYRWANAGKVAFFRLPSGALRFRREDVLALLKPGKPRHPVPVVESKAAAIARRRETITTLKEFGLL